MDNQDPVCTADDIYGTTWGLFPDGSYATQFGNLAPWRPVDREEVFGSILDLLSEGGDQAHDAYENGDEATSQEFAKAAAEALRKAG